jgi:hypothetical protein
MHDSDIHVVPDEDLRHHSMSMRCDCRPCRDLDPDVVVHSAFDGRELREPDYQPRRAS